MNWINISEKKPAKTGKYVVRTATPKGNSNIFETIFNMVSETFTVSNQKVTHWLEHEFDFEADLKQKLKK